MLKTSRVSLFLSLLVITGLTGCAAAAGGSGGTDRSIITNEEIASANVSNLYDVVQRLRPRWLDVRGGRSLSTLSTDIVVYQGETYLGGIDVLRQFGPEAVSWLEYMPGSKASNVLAGLGSRHVEGAIILHTLPREP